MNEASCSSKFISNVGVNVTIPGSGSLVLGAIRILAFVLLLANNWRNRVLLDKKGADTINVVKGLVLPSYFPVIYTLIGIDLVFGILNIVTSAHVLTDYNRDTMYLWVYPIEFACFHCLYEGIAIFLMRYGAGKVAFTKSIMIAFFWGLVSFVVVFIELSYAYGRYGLNSSKDKEEVYSVFVVYAFILLFFYLAILLIPKNVLYRRPALDFYAVFNVAIQLLWILIATLVHFVDKFIICGASVLALLVMGFCQPMIIWLTLQRDSQYWQGLCPDPRNPLSEVWDQVDIATATTMGEGLTEYEGRARTVPLLHFGLITLEENIGYVAGGFSRVYFGKLKGQKVALKVMFAMELTAQDVKEFFVEARVLHDLRHENVVECKGICVMPPAVTIVLEYCAFGSLFDFIYKSQAPLRDVGGDVVGDTVVNPVNYFRVSDLFLSGSRQSSDSSSGRKSAFGWSVYSSSPSPSPGSGGTLAQNMSDSPAQVSSSLPTYTDNSAKQSFCIESSRPSRTDRRSGWLKQLLYS